jgi:hypothetical protein
MSRIHQLKLTVVEQNCFVKGEPKEEAPMPFMNMSATALIISRAFLRTTLTLPKDHGPDIHEKPLSVPVSNASLPRMLT